MAQVTNRKAPTRTQGPTTQRMSASDRRQQLIDTALELFSRHGFSGTPLHRIAAAAGVSEAIIYRHFSTKQEFYSAILEDQMRVSQAGEWAGELETLADSNDDEGVIRSVAAKILASYGEHPHFQRLMLYASLEGHEIAPLFQRGWGMPIYELLHQYVLRRQHDGVFRAVDPGIAVHTLVASPVYHAMVSKLFGTDVLRLSDTEFVDQVVELILNGLRVNPASKRDRPHSGVEPD